MAQPAANRVEPIKGSGIDPEIIARVHATADGYQRILVCRDSTHTHEHVFAALGADAPLATPGSDCVVFDTIIVKAKIDRQAR
jgi:cephalosporin hydroxylase